jgi:hypothetical protein
VPIRSFVWLFLLALITIHAISHDLFNVFFLVGPKSV